jgi:hypothetical protein
MLPRCSILDIVLETWLIKMKLSRTEVKKENFLEVTGISSSLCESRYSSLFQLVWNYRMVRIIITLISRFIRIGDIRITQLGRTWILMTVVIIAHCDAHY